MRRYLLFAGEDYYPDGGWSDLVGEYDTPEEAERTLLQGQHDHEWAHIVDYADRSIIRVFMNRDRRWNSEEQKLITKRPALWVKSTIAAPWDNWQWKHSDGWQIPPDIITAVADE